MVDIKRSNKLKFHSYYEGKLWASRGRSILTSRDGGETWKIEYKVKKLNILNHIENYNRLTRSGISNILNINENTELIVVKRYLLVYRDKRLVKKFKITRGSRPIRECINVWNNNVIYGDYWDNKNRVSVNVYLINFDDLSHEKILTLNDVRHVHFVKPVKNSTTSFYLGTGDRDSESKIMKYDISKNILTTIGEGNQSWRAVSLIEDECYLYWGTDAPDEQNYIYKLNKSTHEKKVIGEVAGPIFYFCKNRQGEKYFGSIVEYKNIHNSKIYSIDNNNQVEELIEFQKDILPQYWFGFGTLEFIKGQEQIDTVFYNTIGLKHIE